MATLYTHRESNIRKTWALITIFLVLITTLGWVFSQIYGDRMIFFVVFAISIIMSISSYWFSDKIVISRIGAREVSFQELPELHRIVENLAITAGLPKPKIYLVDTQQPNAFATGRNPEHAVVAVTSGLLRVMEKSELEGILAHEMSHIGNRDMLVSTVVVVLVGVVQMLADFFIRSSLWGGGNRNRKTHPAIILIGVALSILAPLCAILIQLAVSRKREFLADATGALTTRYPEGLAHALEKLANDHTPMRQASRATAHLWLDDPYQGKGKKTSWLTSLFMTHPPIEERIKRLRELHI